MGNLVFLTAILSLCPVTTTLEGNYTCVASSTISSDAVSFNVTVINEPGIVVILLHMEPLSKGHFGPSFERLSSSRRSKMNYAIGKGSRIVSFIGKLSLSRRVLYRRFHLFVCFYYISYADPKWTK